MQGLRGLGLTPIKYSLPPDWPSVYLRKLSDDEQPLRLRLLAGPNEKALSFVLKENDSGEVNVSTQPSLVSWWSLAQASGLQLQEYLEEEWGWRTSLAKPFQDYVSLVARVKASRLSCQGLGLAPRSQEELFWCSALSHWGKSSGDAGVHLIAW